NRRIRVEPDVEYVVDGRDSRYGDKDVLVPAGCIGRDIRVLGYLASRATPT
ncbi:unnamed protein product, partial [marine sediment metagenome]